MPTITLDDRLVTYDEAGDGPGAALLLVHGFSGGRDDFAGVIADLAADRRVVAVDLPGHGGSAGSDDPAAYGLAQVASWVLRFADVLDLGELHLLGHSLGGLVVQRVASTSSQRLSSLVLMDTGLGALREEAADDVVEIALAARDDGPEAALEASLDGADIDADERAAALRRFSSLNPAALVGGARGLVGASPLTAFLRGIDIPVLVVHGADDDKWGMTEQRLLARTVAGAVHAVVPDAAHSPQRENPEAWLAIVRAFLRRVEETR